jgi:DNA-binding response OmpR family regulator
MRLLVVEDDLLVALELSGMLRDLGYQVVGPAASIADALPLLDPAHIDGALVDLDLGGEKATAIADTLLALGIPFVISSGYTPDVLPLRYSTIPCLPKPFLGDELRATCAATFPLRLAGI